MTKYYSQRGEDFILNEMFNGKKKGFFVEVGCIDGRRFSNTLVFEQLGWKGICIEAHEDYIELLKQNRSKSIVCHCAVADTDEDTVTFYANKRGSLSTLDRSAEARWQKDYSEYFTGFEEQVVQKRTLNSLFAEHGVKRIDVLSIDIEGYEVQALKGLDLQKYRPVVIVVESDSKEQETELDEILLGNGYKKSIRVSSNIFYLANSRRLEKKVLGKAYFIDIIHTGNPFFPEDDVRHKVKLDLQRRTCRMKIVNQDIAVHSQDSSIKASFLLVMSKIRKFVSGSPAESLQASQKVRKQNKRKTVKRQMSQHMDVGFHGDRYLLDLVGCLFQHCQAFIETGANVGTTASYVGRTFPHVPSYSCEPDPTAFATASENTKDLSQVQIFNQLSPDFLYSLHQEHPELVPQTNLYWLDAHGYGFQWPLNDEVRYVTETLSSGCILIDDFRVPERPEFKFCQYDGQICEFEMIAPHLSHKHQYTVIYQNYTDRTSSHHPLVGVILIVFGIPNFQLPAEMVDKFSVSQYIPSHGE